MNPVQATREAWLAVASRAQTGAIEIEVVCSDRNEHRRRVENRATDIPGLRPPTWREVEEREYDPWEREHVVIDTARGTLEDHVQTLRAAIRLALAADGAPNP